MVDIRKKLVSRTSNLISKSRNRIIMNVKKNLAKHWIKEVITDAIETTNKFP